MKKVFLIVFLLSIKGFSQKSINNYKYIIVPEKFDFVKKRDGYRTSSLTKFLFNKYGFKAFLSNENLPEDVKQNRCLALTANVKNSSNFFTTKNTIELKDCNNNIVFTALEGKSKIKDYKKAYQDAIRKSFKSIQHLNYKYKPLASSTKKNIVTPNKETVKILPTTTNKDVAIVKKSLTVLYAQPKPNGYQLVNAKPEVVFQLLKTNVSNVFVLKNKNGILYKNNNSWTAEYHKNDKKIIETYNVKF